MVLPAVAPTVAPEAIPTAFPARLAQGYQAFLQGRFARERARYQALGEGGQNPAGLAGSDF